MPISVIIGGGFGGLMAAYWAANQGRGDEVVLLERANACCGWMKRKGLEPVPICTTAPESADLEASYPRSAAFAGALCEAWSGSSTYDWLKSLELPVHCGEDGTVRTDAPESFCEGLVRVVEKSGVRLETGFSVETISRQSDGEFRIWSRDGRTETAGRLLLATGGERNHGRVLARESGLHLEDPLAAFIRLRAVSPKAGEALAMTDREVALRCAKTGLQARGKVDFTARGLEGPALSELSSRLAENWAQRGWKVTIEIDWMPEHQPAAMRQQLLERSQAGRRNLIGQSPLFGLNGRQWLSFLNLSRIDPETPWLRLKTRKLNTLVQRIKSHSVSFSGMGLPSGERAWLGGVRTEQLDPRRLSASGMTNLHVAGELIDVLGTPNGRHLNLIWASGHIAGSAMGLPETSL